MSERRRALAALAIAVTIWAGTFVVTKSVVGEFGPFTVLTARFSIAFLCLVPFARRHGYKARMSVQRSFVLFGLTGIVLHLGFETAGLLFTSASSASLVVAAIPGVTAGMSAVVLDERLRRSQWLGIALSIAGVAIVTQARASVGGAYELLGNALVFGGVIAWAVFTIQGKKMSTGGVSPLVATTAAAGGSLFFLVPLAAGELFVGGMPEVTTQSLVAIAYLGIGASAVAFALWNNALENVTASVAGAYINLVPIIGLILATIAGETITAVQVAGGAVAIGGFG